MSGRTLLVAGGEDGAGASLASLVDLRLSDGRVVGTGRLAQATHDAAGWGQEGGLVIAGGGTEVSVATVQRLSPNGAGRIAGALPSARSDSVAVGNGRTVFVVGGYDGRVLDPAVLGTVDGGATFSRVARLLVPVRYPAVAISGTTLWVLGGQTARGLSDAVQRVDTVTGAVRLAGRLPVALDAAAAWATEGAVFVFGGASAAGTTAAILRCNLGQSEPTSGGSANCAAVGRLPGAVQNAALAGSGRQVYLVGGQRGDVPLDEVVSVTAETARAHASADGTGQPS